MAGNGNPFKIEIDQQGGITTLVLTRHSTSNPNPKRKVISISVASNEVVSVDIVDPDAPMAKKAKAGQFCRMDQTAAPLKSPVVNTSVRESNEALVTQEEVKIGVTVDAMATMSITDKAMVQSKAMENLSWESRRI